MANASVFVLPTTPKELMRWRWPHGKLHRTAGSPTGIDGEARSQKTSRAGNVCLAKRLQAGAESFPVFWGPRSSEGIGQGESAKWDGFIIQEYNLQRLK